MTQRSNPEGRGDAETGPAADRVTALEQRLSALEGQNRWLRRGLAAGTLLVAAGLMLGAGGHDSVSAKQFLLLDGANNRRAELSLAGEASQLLLFDKNKNVRLNMTVQASGQPMMIFYDGNKRPRSMLSTKADGSQAWVLFDASQRARASLAMRKDGSPLLYFTDTKGKIVRMIPRR